MADPGGQNVSKYALSVLYVSPAFGYLDVDESQQAD